MIASLPMYDRPQTAAAHDRLWAAIRENLGKGPPALTRDGKDWNHWQSPDLLLSQTCGLPFRSKLQGKVQLVGTPDYGLTNCPPGYYRSVLVVRANDPRDRLADIAPGRFAYNEALSQSGWAAAFAHLAERGLGFGTVLETGSHLASARAVALGRADFASIDAVTWNMACRWDAFTENLRVLETTEPTPGLPLITALSADSTALFHAVSRAIRGLSAQDRHSLQLRRLVAIPAVDYLALPTPPSP